MESHYKSFYQSFQQNHHHHHQSISLIFPQKDEWADWIIAIIISIVLFTTIMIMIKLIFVTIRAEKEWGYKIFKKSSFSSPSYDLHHRHHHHNQSGERVGRWNSRACLVSSSLLTSQVFHHWRHRHRHHHHHDHHLIIIIFIFLNRLEDGPPHTKNWRPQILILSKVSFSIS